MRNLLLLAYEAAAVLLPGLVLCAALYRRGGKTGRAAPPLLLLLFAIYLFGVFHVTGAGTMYDALQRGLEWNAGQVNLLPFSREADPMGYALNVVLFLPFGLIMGLRHKTCNLRGIQFHPESVLTPQGKTILANWITKCNR